MLSAVGALLLSSGCKLALDAPDYRVVESAELVDLYAKGSKSCAACLSSGACGRQFEACARFPGCFEFSRCLTEAASPATPSRCQLELDPTEELTRVQGPTKTCVDGCRECWKGEDFACVDNYDWPGNIPNTAVEITQTLLLSDFSSEITPLAGATVSFCSGTSSCDTVQAQTTDAEGTYRALLPIGTGPPYALNGFRGYRRVERSDLDVQWLHTNVPILVNRSETTRLLDHSLSQAVYELGALLHSCETRERQPTGAVVEEAVPALPDGVVGFQVFDCSHFGAAGAVVSIADSEGHHIVYLRSDTLEVAKQLRTCSYRPEQLGRQTLSSFEGAGAIFHLTRGRTYDIRVYVGASGALLAQDTITVPEQGLLLISLYPRWRQEQ